MSDWFALTTRGLEFVSQSEITALPMVTAVEQNYRRVLFAYSGPSTELLQLRTIDDVFIHVATWQGIDRPRTALERLRRLSGLLDLEGAAESCAAVRPLSATPSFSVTVSFVGKRNYTTDEIKGALAEGIEVEHAWSYETNDAEADLNIRLFIEHESALVGVRLARTALHERAYKRTHLSGSLKPPVAAALVRLASAGVGLHVVDPCCGVGTIPIEAALIGAVARGGDSDPVAVTGAHDNAAAAGVAVPFETWDVQALPLTDGSVDRIVSNLPWGRQIVVDASLAAFYRRALGEIRRVLAPDGCAVLLTSVPELLVLERFDVSAQFEISLFGQRPHVTLLKPA